MENYESQAHECWLTEAIPRHMIHTYFIITTIPKVLDNKVQEYPTLVPTINQLTNLPPLWYKDRDSPSMHTNEVSKIMGEQG